MIVNSSDASYFGDNAVLQAIERTGEELLQKDSEHYLVPLFLEEEQ